VGDHVLAYNSSGDHNTGCGAWALEENITGDFNTAVGTYSLLSNTEGSYSTAIGYGAMAGTTNGGSNVAIGYHALWSNVGKRRNTVVGIEAMFYADNTTANDDAFNTAIGYRALYGSTTASANTGTSNTAVGDLAMSGNTSGGGNVAIGRNALDGNTTGSNNTAVGFGADVSSNNLTNATAIGYNASVNASNKIVIGNSSAITVGGYGNWSNYSDRRLKENITYTHGLGLEFIMKMKPVSYNYIDDENKRRRDGLIAQDVQQSMNELGLDFSGLIVDDDAMGTLNLSYSEFVIPLINAVQEQQAMIEQLQQEIRELKAERK
jgi:hypothetical protein